MKNYFIIGLLAVLSLYSCTPEETPPNIIFMMSDDHAYQAISAYGHGLNSTPNIDRIAEGGMLFTDATVTNSICAPSRAVMLTGKHSIANGKVDNFQPFNWDQPNFAKELQKNGYATAMIGKIHLDGLPQGFDYSAVLPGQGNYYNPDFLINGKEERLKGYVTDITTKLALKWLKGRDKDKPFMMIYNQKAPHREWLPAVRHYKEYTKMNFKEPSTLFDDYKGRGTAAKTAEMGVLKYQNWAGDSKIDPETMKALHLDETSDWGIKAWEKNLGRMSAEQRKEWDAVYNPIIEDFSNRYPEMSEKELLEWRYQRYMQDYLGCVASVDEGIGELLDYLKAEGLEENTVIVYTSDNGFYLGEHGWFDKRFMYEESMRVPLIIRYPKEIPAGVVSDDLLQNIDFAPSLLDYAGVAIPEEMQGESFRPLLSGETDEWRDGVYYTYYEYPSIHMVKRHYGVRTKRYKLIHFYYDIDEWELYDLEKDPHELTNVYDDASYSDVRITLHKQLKSLRTQYGDSDELDQENVERYLENVKDAMSGL